MPAGSVQHRRGRLTELDGIRGVAIVLVVLSHGWTLWPLPPLRQIAPFDGLFHAGNVAVTVFLVIGGFSVTRSLLRRDGQPGGIKPLWYVAERFARVGPQLYAVLAAVLLVHFVDRDDPYSLRATLQSIATAATHTWNWYVQNKPLQARTDFGHLWYLSVSEQFYVGLTLVLVLFLRRHRTAVTVGVAVVLVLVTIWRAHAFHTEGWFRPSVRTTVRMDGLLWGTLAALTVERLGPLIRPRANRLMTIGLVGMAVVVLSTGRLGDNWYYTGSGVVMNAAATLFVLAVFYLERPSRARTALTRPGLVRLGVMSLAVYVWHFPIFWVVSRHTLTWKWFPRTVLAAALLVVVVFLAQRYLDPPTRRMVAWLADRQARPRRRSARAAQHVSAPAAEPAHALQERHGAVV
jgi:peptidoglycan/LPS O-acetylase OafA/YrhL